MIIVNGDEKDFEDGMTIAALLKKLGFVFPLLVVRRNGILVDRGEYARVTVLDGDKIDILHLISGG